MAPASQPAARPPAAATPPAANAGPRVAATTNTTAATQGAAGLRPYQEPRILFREPLEAMAAICSPHPPAKANKGLCPMGPISS
jgi:hypothetical protein